MIRGPMPVSKSRAQPPRYAVVMAGGFGTRFWPYSRRRRPKQFLAILRRRTMLQETVHRLRGVVPLSRILVVASPEFMPIIRQQVPELSRAQLLVEPAARGTAPCLALAAEWIARKDPNALMGVFPSDHVILDVKRFQAAVRRSFEVAGRGCLVTFGIVPTCAETGYGYIEVGAAMGRSMPLVHTVAGFYEKPSASKAKAYVRSGRYRWNSGMFVWSVPVIQRAFARHAPPIMAAARAVAARRNPVAVAAYRRLKSQSVDVAIMERAEDVAVVDGDFGWSDVGSWAAVPGIWKSDKAGNAVRGAATLIDCKDTLVFAPPQRMVAAIGVSDLVIVDTPDAVLVCPRERAQDVRRIVDALNRGHGRRWL